MVALFKFALILICMFAVFKLLLWLYRRPQRKLAEQIERDRENDPLKNR